MEINGIAQPGFEVKRLGDGSPSYRRLPARLGLTPVIGSDGTLAIARTAVAIEERGGPCGRLFAEAAKS